MGTEWSSKINAKIADLAAQRDRWQREWRLLNAANIKAEERIKEVEAELTKERNRSILTATMIRENEHLTKENMRLRAALGSTTDDAKPMCASLDTTGCKP